MHKNDMSICRHIVYLVSNDVQSHHYFHEDDVLVYICVVYEGNRFHQCFLEGDVWVYAWVGMVYECPHYYLYILSNEEDNLLGWEVENMVGKGLLHMVLE